MGPFIGQDIFSDEPCKGAILWEQTLSNYRSRKLEAHNTKRASLYKKCDVTSVNSDGIRSTKYPPVGPW